MSALQKQLLLLAGYPLPQFPDSRTLAQSTHLDRRVRSFKTIGEHPELFKALQNMTCLRDLILLDSGS